MNEWKILVRQIGDEEGGWRWQLEGEPGKVYVVGTRRYATPAKGKQAAAVFCEMVADVLRRGAIHTCLEAEVSDGVGVRDSAQG